jgi:hypothetical protein
VSSLLDELLQELDKVELEPSALRSDWSEQKQALDDVEQALGALNEAAEPELAQLEGDNLAVAKGELALPALRIAALQFAAGRKDRARAILTKTRDWLDDPSAKSEVTRAMSDMASFTRMTHARWLLRQGRTQEAKAEAKSLLDSEYAESARQLLEAPEPIDAAPTLGTFNGFGLGVYGERDRWADGSYVTTRFFTALFVPILPVDAYRVSRYEDGYTFFGKVPLSRAVMWWRRLLVSAVLVFGLGGWAYNHWTSPSQRLKRAIAALVKEESSATEPAASEQLLKKHEELFQSYGESVTPEELWPASEAIVRLSTRNVAEPIAGDGLEAAMRALRRYGSIPSEYRGEPSSQALSKKIESWITALGEADEKSLGSSLRLLETGTRVLVPADAKRLTGTRDRLELKLSDVIAKDWPLASVRICCKLADRPEAGSCGARVDALGDDMSRLVELESELRTFADKTRSQNPARASQLEQRLERARRAYDEPARKKLLESEDENALREARLASLHDQDVAVAVADIELGKGDPEKAKATLESLGPAGNLVWSAQQELALVLGELGEVQRAESLLERMLAERLPEYEAAPA